MVKAHSRKYEPPLLRNPTGRDTSQADGDNFGATGHEESGFADLARKSGRFTRRPSKASVIQDAQAVAGAGGAPHGGGGTGGGEAEWAGGREKSFPSSTYV